MKLWNWLYSSLETVCQKSEVDRPRGLCPTAVEAKFAQSFRLRHRTATSPSMESGPSNSKKPKLSPPSPPSKRETRSSAQALPPIASTSRPALREKEVETIVIDDDSDEELEAPPEPLHKPFKGKLSSRKQYLADVGALVEEFGSAEGVHVKSEWRVLGLESGLRSWEGLRSGS